MYRSYPIKGRTPLTETQKNVRNKSTIVFQKCNPNNTQSLLPDCKPENQNFQSNFLGRYNLAQNFISSKTCIRFEI